MADTSPPITPEDVASMVSHWLGCPVGGYYGSDYGSDIKSVLQTPMASGIVNDQITKCRQDIPILTNAPPDVINVYSYDADIDRKAIVFEVAGQAVSVEQA